MNQEATYFDSMLNAYRQWQQSGFQDRTAFATMIGALGGLAALAPENPFAGTDTRTYASLSPEYPGCVVTNVIA